MRLIAFAASALAVALATASCAHEPGVLRVVDGRVVEGRYVEPEAYASFLRGALAEEAGDLAQARTAYGEAARNDADDPEIWTRIAAVECRIDARSAAAEEALSRALALDATYAGALGVKASCALLRGDSATDAAQRAIEEDAQAIDLQILRARAAPRDARGAAEARERLVALTLLHGERSVAWQALASWARSHDEVELYARALAELARRGLGDREELAASVVALAGEGEASGARRVAAALADARRGGMLALSLARFPLVARLAVDEAIIAGDIERVRSRATATHVGLEEAAARSLLLGNTSLARALAEPIALADPRAVGARLVLAVAAAEHDDLGALGEAFRGIGRGDSPVAAGAAMRFALLVARAISPEEARRVLTAIRRAPLLSGDAVITGVAVELAARGVLPEDELPLDAAVELAMRRSQPPPAAALTAGPGALDARHELLARVAAEPGSQRTRHLAALLARRRTDPLVAIAEARLELAAHPDGVDPAIPARLLALDPADPLLVVTALELARHRGDTATVARARTALVALARTPAEHARIVQ